jgi:hypothetical protein
MARATQIGLGVMPAGRRPAPTPRKPCQVCGKRNCTCIEDALAGQMRQAGFPEPVRELHFAREIGRGWKSEFGWPFIRLLVEVEGGTWSAGAHVRGLGYEEDCIKYSEAAILGWCVVRVTTSMVRDGRALALIEKAMKRRGVKFGEGNAVYTVKYPVH